jgi:hypothetical protein
LGYNSQNVIPTTQQQQEFFGSNMNTGFANNNNPNYTINLNNNNTSNIDNNSFSTPSLKFQNPLKTNAAVATFTIFVILFR